MMEISKRSPTETEMYRVAYDKTAGVYEAFVWTDVDGPEIYLGAYNTRAEALEAAAVYIGEE